MNLRVLKKFLFVFICFYSFFFINKCYAEEESQKTLDNVSDINCYQGFFDTVDDIFSTGLFGDIFKIIKAILVVNPICSIFFNYGGFWLLMLTNTIERSVSGFKEAFSDLLMFFTGDLSNNLAFQQAFKTNKYCKYQDIFIEEDDFLKETTGGRYSMFPVYPYESQHNRKKVIEKKEDGKKVEKIETINENVEKTNIILNEKGQCEITDDFIDENIKLLTFTTEIIGAISGAADGYLVSKPAETKCSYSYSSGNISCVLENALPLVVTAEAASLAVAIICASTGISSIQSISDPSKWQMFKNILSLVVKAGVALIQVGGAIASSLLAIFAMPMFQADAYSIKQYYGTLMSTTGILSIIISLIELNFVCTIATTAELLAIETVLPAAADIVAGVKYHRATKLIKEIKFCGYDWNNYAGKYGNNITKYVPLDSTEDELKKIEYYEKGMFKGSYGYAVVECLNAGGNESICNDALKFVDNKYSVNSIKSENLDNISPTSMDLRNKLYREFLYSGKEYTFPYRNITNNQGEPVSYDPRLTQFKGYNSVSHKYYMRGNDKANYACNRFIYNGLGCFLKEEYISEEDRKCFAGSVVSEDGVNFYPVQGTGTDEIEEKDSNPTQNCEQSDFIYIYGKYCEDEFNRAYEECINRSRTVACIENTDPVEDDSGITFCKASGEVNLEERQSLYLTMSAIENGETEGVCEIKYNPPTADVAGGNLELLAVKKPEGEYICVYTFNNCPYDFKLNAGLNYKSGYCEADYVKKNSDDNVDAYDANVYKYNIDTLADPKLCGVGIFNYNTCTQLRKADGVDDIKTPNYSTDNGVADYNSYAFNKLKNDLTLDYYANDYLKVFKNGDTSQATAANGQLKNFCQYKAHCVKVEKSEIYDPIADKVGAFIDQSCNGKSAHSRNISEGYSRQLTATVAECVYETLKNLVNGVAGYSSCKAGYNLNTNGYCGSDTKDIIEKYQTTISGRKYLNNRYNFIKGYALPEDVNPALKLQKNFRRVVITVLSLSLMVWGFKMIVLGEHKKIKDFGDRNFIKSLMPNVMKFVIVVWLALGSGWREGLADRLFDFTSAVYEFSNRIILGAIMEERNQILKEEVFLGIEQRSYATGKSELMCFNAKEGAFSWHFEKQNEEDICNDKNKYVKLSNNKGISQFIYFVDKQNDKSSNYEYKIVKVIMKDGNIDKTGDKKDKYEYNINSIWNDKYDGCYFDTSEYEDSKSYIALFDSIDCRIVKYFGFAPNLNIANVFLLSLMFIFFSTLGSALLSLVMTFVFAIFNLVLEILYIFIMSFFTLSLMIFVSPIILPLSLFKRTEPIFKKWLEKIISCVFQPAILVVAVVLFLNILDALVLKDMTFLGHTNRGRYPNIQCTENVSFFCVINDPRQVFNLAGDTITEGFNLITGVIKGGGIDLESMSLLKLIFDVLVVFILFWLGDTLISYAKQISEFLFGKSGIDGNSGAGKMISSAKSQAKAMSNEIKQDLYGKDGKSGFIGATFSRPAAKIDHLIQKKENLSKYLDEHQENNDRLKKLREGIHSVEKKVKDNTIGKIRKGLTDKINKHYKKKQYRLKRFEKRMNSINRADKHQKRQLLKLWLSKDGILNFENFLTKEGFRQSKTVLKTILHKKDKTGKIKSKYMRDYTSKRAEKYKRHQDKWNKVANLDSFDLIKFMDKADSVLNMSKKDIKDKIKNVAKNKFEEKKENVKTAFKENKILRMLNTNKLSDEDNKKFIESSFAKEFDNDIFENRRMIDEFLSEDEELMKEYEEIKEQLEKKGESFEDADILYELINKRKDEGKHTNRIFEVAVLNLKEDTDMKNKFIKLAQGKGRVKVQRLAHKMKKQHGNKSSDRKARDNDIRGAVNRRGAIRYDNERNNLIYGDVDGMPLTGGLFDEEEVMQNNDNEVEQNNN